MGEVSRVPNPPKSGPVISTFPKWLHLKAPISKHLNLIQTIHLSGCRPNPFISNNIGFCQTSPINGKLAYQQNSFQFTDNLCSCTIDVHFVFPLPSPTNFWMTLQIVHSVMWGISKHFCIGAVHASAHITKVVYKFNIIQSLNTQFACPSCWFHLLTKISLR